MEPKKKILIIDDEVTLRQVVRFHLEQTDRYTVYAAVDGQEGIQKALARKPDLILLDILMPGMSGNDVMEQLQNEAVTRNIPVIFLTGAVTKDDIKSQGGVVGGRRFIAKPVIAADLISVVDSIFE